MSEPSKAAARAADEAEEHSIKWLKGRVKKLQEDVATLQRCSHEPVDLLPVIKAEVAAAIIDREFASEEAVGIIERLLNVTPDTALDYLHARAAARAFLAASGKQEENAPGQQGGASAAPSGSR